MSAQNWIVSRPIDVVQLLSPTTRWDVTRRNPLYLMFRDAALLPNDGSPEQQLARRAAKLILQQIGVIGAPPSPAIPADQLDEAEIDSIWKDGAIAPMTIRALVTILAGHLLSAETKRTIAQLLTRAIDVDPDDSQANYDLINSISETRNEQFDLALPNLAVCINPHAPKRAIAGAIDKIVRDYRKQNDIPEQRRRDDKIDEYLAVWDLREGWNGSGYDCQQEKGFREISQLTGETIATLSNRYNAAFRYIIGRDYSPELWSRTIGIPKLAGKLGVGLPRISRFRPQSTRRKREVLSSALSSASKTPHGDFMQQAGMKSTDIEEFELLDDIRTLISAGRTNEEIQRELEMSGSPELIEYLRIRRED